jgi:hypothetical protein
LRPGHFGWGRAIAERQKTAFANAGQAQGGGVIAMSGNRIFAEDQHRSAPLLTCCSHHARRPTTVQVRHLEFALAA